ncbi:hypothetical protein QTI66_00215 [Variovorax sp. J22R133]|uniref:hypothetical protein n=1 Tax=Variovorax brevis TaxID=3053503 RepID=UPI002577ABEA|nr:hypothetical protein [Variovorax sp. J22R133]MDM0110551.1 hypothetical protein [Variovorax sp. J22R133]
MKNVFILRGLFNGLFALYLACTSLSSMRLPMPNDGYYALLDGLLGLWLSTSMLRDARGEWLFPLVLVDALARVAFGSMIVGNPAVHTVIGWLFYSAIGIASLMALGIAGMLYVFVGKRIWRRTDSGARALARPAFFASTITLLFGMGLNLPSLSSESSQRLIVFAYTLVFGMTLLLAGLSLSIEGEKSESA